MPYETPTWTERLILANQFEILAVLRNNNEFALTAQSFRLGHEWLYKKCFHDFLNDMPSADANEVVSILYLSENSKTVTRTSRTSRVLTKAV
ncbi:MAG: YfbU family protein [Burkholderiales bacterium]|nr:YfbU family protein [Burkholderiales bacterium]